MIAQGRIRPDEETVLCITGNGLKTTDALVDRMTLEEAIEPRLVAFEKFMGQAMAVSAVPESVPSRVSVSAGGAPAFLSSCRPHAQTSAAPSIAPASR